ncbi:DedA family protein [Leptolyngbya sp. FACHB-711]|uniref:DedA family protein n=1 Tax=unclassified Leptolyngbya TaxID=2650499 RepID=UPI001684B27B|nr:DedA family protein [Leptolyngbya sp. FACHB-711]MBD1850565.1 DedA family protein [Cyanobacteria bacterium FACHB-502]MBD2026781.1 DedA family protein [Leptolyngbya sp. FACHB-711]
MAEWITNTMNSLGYVGIALLMFLENLFPPIPSELIMPLAGFTVAQGKMSFVPAVLAGVVGTMVGAIPWYYLGKILGEERIKGWLDRHGKWLGISSEEVTKSQHWFYRHGTKAVFFGRLVPGIRTLISLPAGFSEMRLAPFLIFSTLGTLAWVSLLTFTGYVLGDNYTLVEEYLAPVSKIALLVVAVGAIVWFIRYRKAKKRA